MLKIIAILLLAVTGFLAIVIGPNASADSNITIHQKHIVSVYDGDTFKINVPNCKYDVLCKEVSVRVSHIDTPEIHGSSLREKQLATEAKNVTANFLKSSKTLKMSCTRDKYFRLNCSVSDGKQDLSELLISNGLAVPYEGGTKTTDWGSY